jgi:membrane-bound lytic murein transglycosylase D
MKFHNVRLSGSTGVGAAAVVGLMGLGGGLIFAPSHSAVETAKTGVREAIMPASTTDAEATVAGIDKTAWDLSNINHWRVDHWVNRFSTDADMRKKFEGFLTRAGRYEVMIRTKLAERNMPQDLFYLAMIESGFQPRAYSPAAASGLWQFVAETGQRYGLRVDGTVDERNDPERATDAALDYLQYMHDRFGSWYLAAAGYNTGENRVARIMREVTGSERGRDQDYYRILSRLPEETRDYVPLMIAAARIAKAPDVYGFDHVEPEQPLEYEVTVTDVGFSLETVARVSGADLNELKLLNPHLRQGRLPMNERFALRLPQGTLEAFEANWASAIGEVDKASQPGSTTYRVRNGDNLDGIARRHGMTVRRLKTVNGLRSDRIRVGQVLKVE